MNTLPEPPAAERIDRLFDLLPAVHRARDAESGYVLQALLRVMAEQLNLVEDDITRVYRNLFIETAEPQVVPYIGALLGWQSAPGAGVPADQPLPEVLLPRREIAHLVSHRRRKGTIALLEDLAQDVAGWPARAVEFFKLLGWAQSVNYLHADRHRLADLRHGDALDRLGSAFDELTHTVDLRRIGASAAPGRHSIPSVGVFVWRLLSRPVTSTPACCIEEAGPHCFTFSVLGADIALHTKPVPEADRDSLACERNLPLPIRRRAFEADLAAFVGPGRSLQIHPEGWAGHSGEGAVPATQLIAANLEGWVYQPPPGFVAVDPVLGRMAFPRNQWPQKGLRVSYHEAAVADIGGGEYARAVLAPPSTEPAAQLYRIGEGQPHARLAQALAAWRSQQPQHAVIEFCSSGVHVEPLAIALAPGQTLQLRAASGVRPVLRLIDWQADLPDAMQLTLAEGSRLTLDGLLVTGRPVRLLGAPREGPASVCGAEVLIRHCTLVPGWSITGACKPRRVGEASLEIIGLRARVRIEHSIVGAIRVVENEVRQDPLPLCITDSIVDATATTLHAISAPGGVPAHALLEIRRCTVFGIVEGHALALAEDSLFIGCVNVLRRQLGCMRFCWVPNPCRTPRRYRCQPDGVIAAAQAEHADDAAAAASAAAREVLRSTPRFTSMRYGQPAYAQLALDSAREIERGAHDESELGVFHDLYQPQRQAALRARLAEATPADMDVALILAN